MWNRQDLKAKGRTAFKRNYWKCVIVAVILALFTSSGSTVGSGNSSNNSSNGYSYDSIEDMLEDLETDTSSDNMVNEITSSALSSGVNAQKWFYGLFERFLPAGASTIMSGIFVGIAGLMIVVLVLLILIFNIVISNVIAVGGARFFTKNSFEPTKVGELFWGFKEGRYVNLVVTQFLKNLFTFLWMLLFIIPGIVKSYEYRMIPYILAEDPETPWREAFARSKQMMYGHKMNAFILDLSFFGWYLLSACTWGLTGVFYSNPYKDATDAELFLALNGGFEGNVPMNDFQTRWQQAYDQGVNWEEDRPVQNADPQTYWNQPEENPGSQTYWNQPEQNSDSDQGWTGYVKHSPDEYEPRNWDDDNTYRE